MPYIRIPKLSGSHPVVLDTAVQVRLRWLLNSVECFNVLGGRVAGGWANNQTHADDLSAAVGAAFNASGLKGRTAANNNFDGVGIRDLRTPNEVEYYSSDGFSVGTGGADSLPNQLAAVVTLRTSKAGKSYRGRTYLSGGDEAQNTATGSIAPLYNTAAVAFLEGVQSAMADEGITLAVLSFPRYANLAPPADVETWPGAVTDVVSMLTRDEQWDTQRRRKN